MHQSQHVIAAVGDNTIDRYLGQNGAEYVGGNALNVAVQLRARGTAVEYYGAVGRDREGSTIEAEARRQGLALSGLHREAGATALTEVRVQPGGDRVFEREDFGVTARYYPEPAEVARIARAEWIHIGMVPRAAELVAEILRSDPDARISQDCAVSTGYRGLAVAFCSAGESSESARRLARLAVREGAALGVATRGAAGSLAFDGSTWWECAAIPIDPVDTTGAGDSFIAGFINGLLDGESTPGALARGSEWAAETCTHVAGFRQ